MTLVAAFWWKKNPKHCISTLIFDENTIKILSKPEIHYFSNNFALFKKQVKKQVKKFFSEIEYFYSKYKQPIKIEFKIVFHNSNIPYHVPSRESKFVYKTFKYWQYKTKKKIKKLKIMPQLRQLLSGRSLKNFNRQLKFLNLVAGKQNTRFEYNLWAVALHATKTTYERKLKKIKSMLIQQFWKTPS